jgi:hypothetical protein
VTLGFWMPDLADDVLAQLAGGLAGVTLGRLFLGVRGRSRPDGQALSRRQRSELAGLRHAGDAL